MILSRIIVVFRKKPAPSVPLSFQTIKRKTLHYPPSYAVAVEIILTLTTQDYTKSK
jgi:hypothetical protein